MKKTAFRKSQTLLVYIAVIFFAGYFFFVLIRSFKNSVVFFKKNRLNVVFYGREPIFVSLGLTDDVHYLAFFSHDLSGLVPGGYGRYKIGSLGKLANLEKKPAIIQKAFSLATSTYIDFYFYPKKAEIYSQSANKELSFLSQVGALFNPNYRTNANFFDRLYLFLTLLNKRKKDFFELEVKKKGYSEEIFGKKYKGYFYQKSLRNEAKKVQIIYNNYKTALNLMQIIEGEGIRVSDLSKNYEQKKSRQACLIKESLKEKSISQTAKYLAKILHCQIAKIKTDDDAIVLILGEVEEKEWE